MDTYISRIAGSAVGDIEGLTVKRIAGVEL